MGHAGGQEPSCREVLEQVYLYLDLECSAERRELIRAHLDRGGPCLREYGIESEVKALVGRCCGTEQAPAELRERIRARLANVVASLELPAREPNDA